MHEKKTIEHIELSLPINAAYVSAARLTASSISQRMGFSIDEIEDIKAAVSEACTYIIKKSPPKSTKTYKITFCLQKDILEIDFCLSDIVLFSSDENEMSIIMIKALVDSLELLHDSKTLTSIKMFKTHKEITFDNLEE